MQTNVVELLSRSRGPAGPDVFPSFSEQAGAWPDLADMLRARNGFFVFDAGVQVFRVGPEGVGPELTTWNAPDTWKDTYQGLAENLFCFAQDLLGTQFALDTAGVVSAFDPETGSREPLGSLDDWAGWLLSDPEVNGTSLLAREWQDANGPLDFSQRLIPRQFFVLGGSYQFQNLEACDSVRAMRIRGPVARQIHSSPDGKRISFNVD